MIFSHSLDTPDDAWLSTGYTPVVEENPDCFQKFQDYFTHRKNINNEHGHFGETFRLRMRLKTNISRTEGWKHPFNNGGEGARGHQTCFRANENDERSKAVNNNA